MSKGLGEMQLAILRGLQQKKGVPWFSREPVPKGVQSLSSLRWYMARQMGFTMRHAKTKEYKSFRASFNRASARLRQEGYLLPVDGLPAIYVRLKPRLRINAISPDSRE